MPAIDFNTGSGWSPTTPTGDIQQIITGLIDGAVIAENDAEYKERGSGKGDVAKNRIGAGYIGTECDRELAFRYHRFPVEQHQVEYVTKGELHRHGGAGHWTEKKTAEWMKLAGFDIRTHKVDANGQSIIGIGGKPEQIGWKSARDQKTGQYRLAGEIDGAIMAVPPPLVGIIKTPCIWESKKATNKKWTKFAKEGVAKADPKYHGQLQTNMAHLEIEQTLFMMLNLDTMKYYSEIVLFNAAKAQELIDRAVRVFRSSHPAELPRIAANSDFFKCRMCNYAGACWSPTP